MPALPPVIGGVRLSLNFASEGGDLTVRNRTFWTYSGPAPTTAQMLTFCTAVGGLFLGHCVGLMVSDWTLTEVIGEDLTTSSSAAATYTTSDAGTRSGGALPVGVCTLINYEIGRRYRGGKPRGYLPFGADLDLVSPREWNSTYTALVNTDWGAFLGGVLGTALGSATLVEQANVSYYEGFTAVENPLTGRWRNVPKLRVTPQVDEVTGFTTNAIIGSQRKRYQRS